MLNMKFLKEWLRHPLKNELEQGFTASALLRRKIIDSKPFLKKVMTRWYKEIAKRLSRRIGTIVELGSGSGFFADYIKADFDGTIITTEVANIPGINLVTRAEQLPFSDSSLAAIVVTNVLHHIKKPRDFFAESIRVLKPSGDILMIEPWGGPWAQFIYSHLHSEPFEKQAENWELSENSSEQEQANNALPWIIFERDIDIFKEEFPELKILEIKPFMPFLFLCSGGIGTRISFPSASFRLLERIERMLKPFFKQLGMFTIIWLRKS